MTKNEAHAGPIGPKEGGKPAGSAFGMALATNLAEGKRNRGGGWNHLPLRQQMI